MAVPSANTIVPAPHGQIVSFVARHSGQNPARCYQCGKCTAGCPVAHEMDMGPRRIMRAVQLGLKKPVLDSNSIWICLQCQMCSARCPMEIDIARVMESLRHLAILESHPAAEKDVELFNKVFLEVVKRHGRAYELELGALYNIRSGHLTAKMSILPHMFSHGKLALLPHGIAGTGDIKQVFQKAETAWREAEKGPVQ